MFFMNVCRKAAPHLSKMTCANTKIVWTLHAKKVGIQLAAKRLTHLVLS